MRDELKQYVEDHRDELDIYQPHERLWDEIDVRLQKNRKIIRWRWLAAAASLLLLLSCGTWIFLSERKEDSRDISKVPPQLNQAEVYYTALLTMKDAELDQYCSPQPELCKEFDSDLEKLQNDYRQLKSEYSTSADRPAILRAIAANLQLQVQLINQQLNIMEQVQTKKEAFKTI